MKQKIVKVMGIISIVLLSCSLLCGVWTGTHPDSDKAFHATLCGVSVGFAIITQFVFMIKCRFCGK